MSPATVERTETVPVRSEADVVQVRQRVRRAVADLSFSLVDQTKMVTAASELARNTLEYGGGGEMLMEYVSEGRRRGLRLTFADEGPGIADISLALTDGYTSGGGLGMGLSGARRLANEFEIESEVGKGTRVIIARWK